MKSFKTLNIRANYTHGDYLHEKYPSLRKYPKEIIEEPFFHMIGLRDGHSYKILINKSVRGFVSNPFDMYAKTRLENISKLASKIEKGEEQVLHDALMNIFNRFNKTNSPTQKEALGNDIAKFLIRLVNSLGKDVKDEVCADMRTAQIFPMELKLALFDLLKNSKNDFDTLEKDDLAIFKIIQLSRPELIELFKESPSYEVRYNAATLVQGIDSISRDEFVKNFSVSAVKIIPTAELFDFKPLSNQLKLRFLPSKNRIDDEGWKKNFLSVMAKKPDSAQGDSLLRAILNDAISSSFSKDRIRNAINLLAAAIEKTPEAGIRTIAFTMLALVSKIEDEALKTQLKDEVIKPSLKPYGAHLASLSGLIRDEALFENLFLAVYISDKDIDSIEKVSNRLKPKSIVLSGDNTPFCWYYIVQENRMLVRIVSQNGEIKVDAIGENAMEFFSHGPGQVDSALNYMKDVFGSSCSSLFDCEEAGIMRSLLYRPLKSERAKSHSDFFNSALKRDKVHSLYAVSLASFKHHPISDLDQTNLAFDRIKEAESESISFEKEQKKIAAAATVNQSIGTFFEDPANEAAVFELDKVVEILASLNKDDEEIVIGSIGCILDGLQELSGSKDESVAAKLVGRAFIDLSSQSNPQMSSTIQQFINQWLPTYSPVTRKMIFDILFLHVSDMQSGNESGTLSAFELLNLSLFELSKLSETAEDSQVRKIATDRLHDWRNDFFRLIKEDPISEQLDNMIKKIVKDACAQSHYENILWVTSPLIDAIKLTDEKGIHSIANACADIYSGIQDNHLKAEFANAIRHTINDPIYAGPIKSLMDSMKDGKRYHSLMSILMKDPIRGKVLRKDISGLVQSQAGSAKGEFSSDVPQEPVTYEEPGNEFDNAFDGTFMEHESESKAVTKPGMPALIKLQDSEDAQQKSEEASLRSELFRMLDQDPSSERVDLLMSEIVDSAIDRQDAVQTESITGLLMDAMIFTHGIGKEKVALTCAHIYDLADGETLRKNLLSHMRPMLSEPENWKIVKSLILRMKDDKKANTLLRIVQGAIDNSEFQEILKVREIRKVAEQKKRAELQNTISGQVGKTSAVPHFSLASLNKLEIAALKYVVKTSGISSENDEEVANAFISMDPGLRELIILNNICRHTKSNNWKLNLMLIRQAYENLHTICGITRPRGIERNQLILKALQSHPELLSNIQKNLIYSMSGRYPTKTDPSSILQASASYDNMGEEKFREKIFNSSDSMRLSLLIRNFKSGKIQEKEGDDNQAFLERLFSGQMISMQDLTSAICSKSERHRWVFSELMSSKIDFGMGSIMDFMHNHDRVYALLAILGKDVPRVATIFENESGIWSKPKNGGNMEDSSLSYSLVLENGRKIRIDAVFDGISGQMGASEASGMAKEIFELAIHCGMLTSLEDAALLAQICDLAITFENMKDGIHDLRSGRGTTFVLTIQEGGKLYSIHAGDSRWRVFREGKAVESSNDHTTVTDLSENLLVAWAQGKYEQFDSMVQVYLGDIDAGSLKEYIANNAPSCVELCNHILWNYSPNPNLSAISSGLGTVFSHLTFNTAQLRWGDVVALYSDGIGDVVCQHKIGAAFSQEDTESGIQAIAQMSESRSVKGLEGKDDCGCNVRFKNDDKSLIAYRYGENEDDWDG